MNTKTEYLPITLDPSIPAHAAALQDYEDNYKPLGVTKIQWATDLIAPDTIHAQAMANELRANIPAIDDTNTPAPVSDRDINYMAGNRDEI